MTGVPRIDLSNGIAMPGVGFGTWPIPDPDAAEMVKAAIEAGYRLIDTAELYRNEEGVVNGVRASGVDRSEVFITTKLTERWRDFEEAQHITASPSRRKPRCIRLQPQP